MSEDNDVVHINSNVMNDDVTNDLPYYPQPNHAGYYPSSDAQQAHSVNGKDEKGETPSPNETEKTPKHDTNEAENTKDIIQENWQRMKGMNLGLKIHIVIATVITLVCFIIWRFTGQGFWWWIYPLFSGLMTVTIHYFALRRDAWKAIIGTVLLLNIMLFWTYVLTKSEDTFPWIMFPIYATIAIGYIIYYIGFKEEPSKGKLVWDLLFIEYGLLSLLLFAIWCAAVTPFPWFMLPIISLSLPFLIRYVIYHYGETRVYVFTGIVFLWLDTLITVIWAFTSGLFPWFIIPVGVTVVIQIVVFTFAKNKRCNCSCCFGKSECISTANDIESPKSKEGKEMEETNDDVPLISKKGNSSSKF